MTPGAFGAIAVALGALVDVGDEVVFFDPRWFFYRSMVLAAGAIPVDIPVRSDDYDLDLDRFAAAITERTRLADREHATQPDGSHLPAVHARGSCPDVLTEAREQVRNTDLSALRRALRPTRVRDATFTSPCGATTRTP